MSKFSVIKLIVAIGSAQTTFAHPLNWSAPVKSSGTCTQVLVGIDCSGSDISSAPGSSVADCCGQCSSLAGCTSFTYRWGTCWFKSACASSTTCNDCSAGILRSVGHCVTKLQGVDCIGNDISNADAPSVDSCCDQCTEMQGCGAFTYRFGKCWFKSGCDKKSSCNDCIAGTATPAPAPPAPPPGPPFAEISGVYSSDDLSALLSPIDIKQASDSAVDESAILVDTTKKYQKIIGFGGAFTEAAGLGFASLSQDDKQKVIDAYYAPPEEGGNGYTVGRVHMNSCDFSMSSYSFDDTPQDNNLNHFDMNVSHDQQTMLPMMRAALARAPEGIKIFASPWSPPAWMKGNGQMTHSSSPCLKDDASRSAWALYFSKFFTAYKNTGVPLWGLTVQNEPGFNAPWEACKYSAAEERDFVKQFLGPVMRRDHPDAKIMVLDHNRDMVPEWTQTIFTDVDAANYVDGLALHWYDSHNYVMYDNVKKAHEQYLGKMGKFMLATEACNCPGVSLRDWGRAWNIASDILGDLNAFVTGWTDWNLVVDHQGGPNHLGNFCDANIVADPQEVLRSGTVIKQVSYYLMGHFSRYLRPGMVRVQSVASNGLKVTAFQDEQTDKVAVVVMNGQGSGVHFALQDVASTTSKTGLYIAPHSIQTYSYKAVAASTEVFV
eukprot:TRINITY_DN6634_c0_g1_i1.p1 TRINITY_DN6634_c0_g1~~TRINITY_DN6634_c0_g1_i1.p1  ORF type:complete len:661 (-),score=80.28 TRINITY_DN6634_c0_g1_i1:410-2392(-)